MTLSINAFVSIVSGKNSSHFENSRLVVIIKLPLSERYHAHSGTLGYRMITDLLKLQGFTISRNTVLNYMSEMNLKAIIMRKKPNYVYGKNIIYIKI